MLEVEKLVRRYGDTSALAGVSFSLNPGICAVVGPNGAGKTTLLRAITGAECADSGSVTLDGMDVHASIPRIFRHISYLSDRVPLYTDLSVEDHLVYRGRLRGLAPLRIRARIRHLAEALDLKPIFAKRTGTLSAGQRKRVGIADAMLTDVRVLAIDEPFEGLDAPHAALATAAFASISRHTLVILATHRPDLLANIPGTCLVLASGVLVAHFPFGPDAKDGGQEHPAPLSPRIADALSAFYSHGSEAAQ